MTFLLNRELAEILFEGFFIQRWNDRLRPIPLVEADKNGNRTILTFFIAKKMESRGEAVNWLSIVDRLIFDALVKYATKDISSVFHAELRRGDKEVYAKSIGIIIDRQYSNCISDKDILKDFKEYVLQSREGQLTLEDKIIRLAHNISIKQEFKIIEAMKYGSVFLGHEHGEETIEDGIAKYSQELGLEEYIKTDEFGLIKQLVDRLRYQVRWSQTPRIPPTNVLGHSFYVASCAYFATRKLLPEARVINVFFGAMLHDYLESLTRDIISPVKSSSPEFRKQVEEIELRMLTENLLPNLSEVYREDIRRYLTDEFSNRGYIDNKQVNYSENQAILEDKSYIDGKVILSADLFAALLEAHQSVNLGISSHHLVGAIARLYAGFKSTKKDFTEDTMEIYNGFEALYESFISR